MKKYIITTIATWLFAISQLYAQDTLRWANSGFEDWTTEDGYDVQASFLSVHFFDSYVHPTSWDRPYYYMNKQISKKVIITVTATINTNVPIHYYHKETSDVTEGTTAACLESFQ